MLGRNWLEEGFYVEDSYGDLTKVDVKDVLTGKYERETLYQHDGYSLNRIGEINGMTKEDLNLE